MTDTPAERDVESTWTRLRRRKVVQWGVVYVAAAWGFLQGLEYLSGTYDWPRQIQQLTTLALLIGLPIVLVLAWYHGDRGQQRISTSEFAILTLLLLLGGGAFWYYQRASEAGRVAAPAATTAKPDAPPEIGDARPSVAVLPFENRSREADDAFFVDGIHDDILTQLSKVSALRVISRTSVEQFRDTKLPMKAIADQLGVKSILEGGVQRAGDRVRINVQLIDAETDAHHWAETYDRELTVANMFAIQSEVATAIAGALRTALTPAEQARAQVVPTQNLDAWEAYQLGKQRAAKRTSDGLTDAERQFRKAIQLDPSFALAYVGLADTLMWQNTYSGRSLQTVLMDAEDAIKKALELDPNLAEAWASRGNIAITQGQYARAEELLRPAVELDPNSAQANRWLSLSLANEGRAEEALDYAARAVRLDPLSMIVNLQLADALSAAGLFDEAAQRVERAIEIDPSAPGPYWSLADLQALALNRQAEAMRSMQRAIDLDAGSPVYLSELARLLLDVGDVPQSTQAIAQARKRWPDSVYVGWNSAGISSSLGDGEAAERYSKRAVAEVPREPFTQALLRNGDLARHDYGSARARYSSVYPELLAPASPTVDASNYQAAIDLVPILRGAAETQLATLLLDGSERVIRTRPRLGTWGYGLADVQVYALRGDSTKALAALRDAQRVGWRGRFWLYYRDFDPNLASIRNEPEFKAVFADIERDMARQRIALAARPKDAPLDLAATDK